MTWYPTNANDVTLVVQTVDRAGDGAPTTDPIASTSGQQSGISAIVVDDFSIDTEEDLEGLSGVGHRRPQAISKGDIEHTFSFTVQGEDAEMFSSLSNANGEARELEIVATFEDLKIEVTGAFAGTRGASGTSGDPTELSVEGMATKVVSSSTA